MEQNLRSKWTLKEILRTNQSLHPLKITMTKQRQQNSFIELSFENDSELLKPATTLKKS